MQICRLDVPTSVAYTPKATARTSRERSERELEDRQSEPETSGHVNDAVGSEVIAS